MDEKGNYVNHLSLNFANNYVRSSIVKESLQEALKNNRIKILNLNTFNEVLFEHESNYLDMLGIEQPENFAQFYARCKARYDKGDYSVCEEIHKYNKDVKDHICDVGLECLFKRVKARNRIANMRETEMYAKKNRTDKFKLPLEYYLAMANNEEIKYFRPLGFILGAEGLLTKYEESASTKTFWMVSREGRTKESEIIKFSFKEREFRTKLDKILIKSYPEPKRKDFEDLEEFTTEVEHSNAMRQDIRERIIAAVATAVNGVERIYEATGSVDKAII